MKKATSTMKKRKSGRVHSFSVWTRENLAGGLRAFGANPPYDYTLQLLERYPGRQREGT
jgi:hypothetical protein